MRNSALRRTKITIRLNFVREVEPTIQLLLTVFDGDAE